MSQNLIELIRWFGEVPNLHDAELQNADFDFKDKIMKLTYKSFAYAKEVEDNGFLKKQKECVVQLIFRSVFSMKFEDIADRNYVSDVKFESFGNFEKFIQNAAYGASIEIIATEIEAHVI